MQIWLWQALAIVCWLKNDIVGKENSSSSTLVKGAITSSVIAQSWHSINASDAPKEADSYQYLIQIAIRINMADT